MSFLNLDPQPLSDNVPPLCGRPWLPPRPGHTRALPPWRRGGGRPAEGGGVPAAKTRTRTVAKEFHDLRAPPGDDRGHGLAFFSGLCWPRRLRAGLLDPRQSSVEDAWWGNLNLSFLLLHLMFKIPIPVFSESQPAGATPDDNSSRGKSKSSSNNPNLLLAKITIVAFYVVSCGSERLFQVRRH